MGLLVYSQVVWLDVSIAGMTGESNRAYVQRRAGDDMPQLQAFTFSSFEPEPILHDATANMDGSFELEGSGQASSEVIYPTGSHPFVDEGSDWKKGQIIENAEVKPTRIVALRFPSIGLEQGTRVITANLTMEVAGMTAGPSGGLFLASTPWQRESGSYEIFAELRPASPILEMETGHISLRSRDRTATSVTWVLPAASDLDMLDACSDGPYPCLQSPDLSSLLDELTRQRQWDVDSSVVIFFKPIDDQQRGGKIFANRRKQPAVWIAMGSLGVVWVFAQFIVQLHFATNVELARFGGTDCFALVGEERGKELRQTIFVYRTLIAVVFVLLELIAFTNALSGAYSIRAWPGYANVGFFLAQNGFVACALHVACAHMKHEVEEAALQLQAETATDVQSNIELLHRIAERTQTLSKPWVVPMVASAGVMLYFSMVMVREHSPPVLTTRPCPGFLQCSR